MANMYTFSLNLANLLDRCFMAVPEMVIPQLDGLFHGKSEDKMDDHWVYHGVPPS